MVAGPQEMAYVSHVHEPEVQEWDEPVFGF